MFDRTFRIKQKIKYSEIDDVKAGIPQRSVMETILYLPYICDIPAMQLIKFEVH